MDFSNHKDGVSLAQRGDYFDERRKAFDSALAKATILSNANAGRYVAMRFGLGSLIYARMGLQGLSVQHLLRSYLDEKRHSTVDHVSVGAICRLILESQVFFSYLVEDGITDDEWNLRKKTLDVHDCNSRIRLFRSLDVEAKKSEFKRILEDLRKEIKELPAFKRLPSEAKSDIFVGKRIYVRGIRAALKEAEWRNDEWDGIYTYLSGSVHSSPISFYLYEQNKIDHLHVADHQIAFIAFALEMATKAIDHASERMADVFPKLEDLPRAAPSET